MTLSQQILADIVTAAAASPLIHYTWHGRGTAPRGYIKGMAVAYGQMFGELLEGKSSAANAMVAVNNNPHDIFEHYAAQFEDAGMQNIGAQPVDRLRHLFVFLTGLGLRESSGRYCEGRDRSADNTTAETAEAGMFQQSWNLREANPTEFEKLMSDTTINGYLDIFKEGVTPRSGDLDNYGSGDGKAFQKNCKSYPMFAVETAAIGLRTLCTHWGPAVRHEVELVPAADDLFKQVQDIVLKQSAPTQPTPISTHQEPLQGGLAAKIVVAMGAHGFRVNIGPGEINIVYVEGMGPDGDKNANAPNEFNDSRLVIGFDGDTPTILGAWQATTEPSRRWTLHPMNPKGAARIKFGQYTAWQVGLHHDHEALIQTGGTVTVCRDLNQDFSRVGDKEDTGYFGINQHWGYDLSKGDLGNSSAGCLVGRMTKGHREFMAIVKSDPRYLTNKHFVFTTCVLPVSDILN